MVGAQAGLKVGKGAFESVYSKHTHTLWNVAGSSGVWRRGVQATWRQEPCSPLPILIMKLEGHKVMSCPGFIK